MEGERRALRCCTDRQESRSSHGAHTLLHCCDRNNQKERSITAYGFGGGCVGGNLCCILLDQELEGAVLESLVDIVSKAHSVYLCLLGIALRFYNLPQTEPLVGDEVFRHIDPKGIFQPHLSPLSGKELLLRKQHSCSHFVSRGPCEPLSRPWIES